MTKNMLIDHYIGSLNSFARIKKFMKISTDRIRKTATCTCKNCPGTRNRTHLISKPLYC